jgi:hypothetical protein
MLGSAYRCMHSWYRNDFPSVCKEVPCKNHHKVVKPEKF